MKTLYESILKSVGAGAYNFKIGDILGSNSSQSYTDIFNMSSIRRELENHHSIITKGMKDGRLIAELLCTFIFTPKEWKTLTKDYFKNNETNAVEVDKILKEKFEPYLRKKDNSDIKFIIDGSCLDVNVIDKNTKRLIKTSTILWWGEIYEKFV